FYLGRERREHVEKVAHYAVVAFLEYRRFGVLVYRYDDLGRAHAGEVLYRARERYSDVEGGRHGLTRLADLHVVGAVARVDRGPRRADRRAEDVGELVDVLEVLLASESPSAGNHSISFRELGPVGFLGLYLYDLRFDI